MKVSQPQWSSALQRLMRGWAELAPYNFIHALRLAGAAEEERWREAIVEALAALGLETASLKIERPATDIDTHVEAELNREFAAGDLPLRFFLLETSAGDHWLGVVFDHWFADDFSSRALLERIYANYRGIDSREITWARRQPARGNWWTEWRSFLQQARALRRAARIPWQSPLDLATGAFRTELPIGALENIRALAKRQDATVHDVFLAAAAQASGAAYPWTAGARRDSIGLVTAMDLRRFETGSERGRFGLLISQYTIVEPHPEEVPLAQLVTRIARKTRALKSRSGQAAFAAGWFMWRLARSRHAKATIYQRGAPFAAGLSNVNLTGSWIEAAGIAEFRRYGPAGPVVPLVLMITTMRGRIFIDTTFRTSTFTRAAAAQLLTDFCQRLTSAHLAA